MECTVSVGTVEPAFVRWLLTTFYFYYPKIPIRKYICNILINVCVSQKHTMSQTSPVEGVQQYQLTPSWTIQGSSRDLMEETNE